MYFQQTSYFGYFVIHSLCDIFEKNKKLFFVFFIKLNFKTLFFFLFINDFCLRPKSIFK